jgi:hypothetical protein
MADEDWSTLAGLREIARTRVNPAGATHGLPAVNLAEYLGYASGTREFSMTSA